MKNMMMDMGKNKSPKKPKSPIKIKGFKPKKISSGKHSGH
jgi:hypothetical protein